MARPEKEGLDYFPHDVDASHDEKVEAICALYGHHVGYSIIFRLYERIYRAGGKLLVSDAETMLILSRNVAEMELKPFKTFINTCLTVGIFDKSMYNDAKILTSNGILKRCEPIISKRLKNKEMYENMKDSRDASGRFQEGFRKVSASETMSETPQSKVKESKVYNTVSNPPTMEEVSAYCLSRGNSIDPEAFWAYYDARGWKFNSGKPVKKWKSCVVTWEKNDLGGGKKINKSTAPTLC